MHQVNLDDRIYEEARRRAEAAGFSSVDDYVADVLTYDFQLEAEDFGHFFTPERLALIDQAAAEAAAGSVHTMDEARESLAKTRDQWLRDRVSGQ